MTEKSSNASNRFVVNKTFPRREKNPLRWQSARYLEDNQIELFKAYSSADQISKTTFIKYLKKSRLFKKPCRLTDLCEYCEKLKKIKKSILIVMHGFNYQSPRPNDELDVKDVKKFLKAKKKEPLLQQDDLAKVFFSKNKIKILNSIKISIIKKFFTDPKSIE